MAKVDRLIVVNCIFNCKYFLTTTLEIWQLLLQTFIVKVDPVDPWITMDKDKVENTGKEGAHYKSGTPL